MHENQITHQIITFIPNFVVRIKKTCEILIQILKIRNFKIKTKNRISLVKHLPYKDKAKLGEELMFCNIEFSDLFVFVVPFCL